jgi:nicotinate phosphoribosyltransferase
VWDGEAKVNLPSLHESRQHVLRQLKEMREDYARPVNPALYKVSVTQTLYRFIHELWASEAPVPVIR